MLGNMLGAIDDTYKEIKHTPCPEIQFNHKNLKSIYYVWGTWIGLGLTNMEKEKEKKRDLYLMDERGVHLHKSFQQNLVGTKRERSISL